ncbi:hypothetical protein NMG60_11024507 [Bertholletia excelsa]
MGSVSSEDDSDRQSERFEDGYCISADVSESESSSTFSYEPQAASSSLTSSPVAGLEFSSGFNFPAPPHITLPVVGDRYVVTHPDKLRKPVPAEAEMSEVELMKERFAKLLLGEDMSGGGKGVCTAVAISNAITNLSATVFGELWKLEPLAPQRKLMWRREMEWLLSVCNSIVELVPSTQEFPGGGTFEVMVTRPRLDLCMNLPALKKLDAMLISMLDGFHDSEFYYIDRGIVVAGGEKVEACSSLLSPQRPSITLEEKWWLPFPKVPPNGLSEDTRKRLLRCRECTNQIFKAATAINANTLADMDVPDIYLDNLPKSGKACLGETLYSYISDDRFSPECLLDYLVLSSEYTTLEIANRIEAAIHIWRQKNLKRHTKHVKPVRSSWGGKVKDLVADTERRKILAERAETLLQNLKLRFPGLPQTALDTNKIQFNKDVGQSILESYSRVMESLAFNIMARIDDLLYVDDATKQEAASKLALMLNHGGFNGVLPMQKRISPSQFSLKHNCSNISSSKQKLGSPMRRYSSVNKKSLWDSLDENLERLTF